VPLLHAPSRVLARKQRRSPRQIARRGRSMTSCERQPREPQPTGRGENSPADAGDEPRLALWP